MKLILSQLRFNTWISLKNKIKCLLATNSRSLPTADEFTSLKRQNHPWAKRRKFRTSTYNATRNRTARSPKPSESHNPSVADSKERANSSRLVFPRRWTLLRRTRAYNVYKRVSHAHGGSASHIHTRQRLGGRPTRFPRIGYFNPTIKNVRHVLVDLASPFRARARESE